MNHKNKKTRKPKVSHEGKNLIAEHDHEGDRDSEGFGSSAVLAVILVVGYLLRSLYLNLKPAHFDEGINGNFVVGMWHDGFYRYDPANYHGPLYFYFLFFAEILFGRGVVAFRWVNGLISLASVFVAYQHRRFFGKAAVWAALLMAVSTGCVFYSRYSIHESLFVFCQILFSYGWFLWSEEKSRRSVVVMSIAFFSSFAVKETYFIFFVTWGIALAINRIWEKLRKVSPVAARRPAPGHVRTDFWQAEASTEFIWLCSGVGAFALIVLFSGFFIHPKGVDDMFLALRIWAKTGTGNSGHEKPFTYWLELLWTYEKPALLALLITLPLFFITSARMRVMTLVAFGTWLAYSLIPYKTPWLILNLLWPLAFVFGDGLRRAGVWLADRKGLRWAAWAWRAGVLAALVTSFMTMLRLNFRDYANSKERYVYVQSTNTMKAALDCLTERLRRFPEDLNMSVKVLVRDPWPLPWLLSAYPNLAYGKAVDSDVTGADVILIDGPDQVVIEPKLSGRYWRVPFQIRDSYENGFAYFSHDKFKGFVPSDSALVEAKGEAKP